MSNRSRNNHSSDLYPPQAGIRHYPWATLGTNLAVLGGSHAIGYFTAGTIADALMKKGLGRRFLRMSPKQRKRVIHGIVTVAGTTASISATLASAAGQQRIAEAIARKIERERQQVHHEEKTASFIRIYELMNG